MWPGGWLGAQDVSSARKLHQQCKHVGPATSVAKLDVHVVLKARHLCGSFCLWPRLGIPEQALGGIPLGFGIAVEDKPSELSCVYICTCIYKYYMYHRVDGF